MYVYIYIYVQVTAQNTCYCICVFFISIGLRASQQRRSPRHVGAASNGHGSKSRARTPSEHPHPTTKMGSKMGGEFTNPPKWDPKTVLTRSQMFLLLCFFRVGVSFVKTPGPPPPPPTPRKKKRKKQFPPKKSVPPPTREKKRCSPKEEMWVSLWLCLKLPTCSGLIQHPFVPVETDETRVCFTLRRKTI